MAALENAAVQPASRSALPPPEGPTGTRPRPPALPQRLPPSPAPPGRGLASARPLRRYPRSRAAECRREALSSSLPRAAPPGAPRESWLPRRDSQENRLRFIPRPQKKENIEAGQVEAARPGQPAGPRLEAFPPPLSAPAGTAAAASRGDDGASFFGSSSFLRKISSQSTPQPEGQRAAHPRDAAFQREVVQVN